MFHDSVEALIDGVVNLLSGGDVVCVSSVVEAVELTDGESLLSLLAGVSSGVGA